MANYTSTPYSKANLTAILAIPRSELPATASSVYPLQMAADTGVIYKFDPDSTTIGTLPTGASSAGRWIPIGREVLQANRTYFVRTDGNDTNNGFANTAGGAFATWQKAIYTYAGLDQSIYDVTIQGNTGTHTVGSTLIIRQALGSGVLTLQGSTSTASDCVLSSSGINTITANGITRFRIQNLTINCGQSGGGYLSSLKLSNCLATVLNVRFSSSGSPSDTGIGLFAEGSTVNASNLFLEGSQYVGVLFQKGSSLIYADAGGFTKVGTQSLAALVLAGSSAQFYLTTFTGSPVYSISAFSNLSLNSSPGMTGSQTNSLVT